MLKSRNKNQTAWRFICILLAVTALLSCFMLSTANAADTTSQSDNTITSAKDIPGKKLVFSLVQLVMTMSPNMRVTKKALRLNAIIKPLMLFNHLNSKKSIVL